MKIIINGVAKTLQEQTTLSLLVQQVCKSPKAVITELNGTIIAPSEWDKTSLHEGDTLELVSFVGGG